MNREAEEPISGGGANGGHSSPTPPIRPGIPSSSAVTDPDAWRQEVAARLTNYRARRRPKEHRYPSLQLKFEPSEPAHTETTIPEPTQTLDGYTGATQVAQNGWPADRTPFGEPNGPDTSARVIPFRRSVPTPPKPLDELAEPLQLFPRIMEVPEVAPPPPALGGILIEPAQEESNPKRPGIEIPLQTSRISLRFFAVGADLLVIFSAFCLFGYIFFQITQSTPPVKEFATSAVLVLAILWAGYQYLLVTYVGSTPGLRLAGLRLSQFDGDPVLRQQRRWRAIASILSAIPLGLGYAWCMLDEDQLCWHDRITKTHLAPKL